MLPIFLMGTPSMFDVQCRRVLLRIRTMLLSRASPFTGYVPDCSFGRVHYFCNGLSAKTDKEKPR